ncbi:helix-turn-helix domain-containing protein [Arenibacter certesii]|uniref:HTH araC/xylS-type domain-containing protein n=1 Tax=Arenibacter certesii TaxID=228955 RepID=A0A918IX45_9FLAO|nr:AraC family transcriptional regulator [Arenibacter certesii]GGW36378.1 hypothetical protein GCM10007383_21660 [Arenibacter certesii]
MPKETESNLLKKLDRFEKTQDFLDKGMSLTKLAAQFEINTRYLSYIIKNQKQKDFASYINELRINYIIDCMKSNPDYLQYKISYLANVCGFSSHTRFSVTFKKVTGKAPSVFMEYLNKP